MLSDDLSSLFGPTPPGAAATSQIRQGVILSFSTVDGSNTVGVGASTLTNVPMLLTGAEVNYNVGDPVLILVLGFTYMILGKVATVGSSVFASASGATSSAQNTASGLVFAAAFTRVITATLTVPTWANAAACTVIGSMTAQATSASTGELQVNAGVTGSTFNTPTAILLGSNPGSTNYIATGSQGFAGVVTGLTGGSTIQAETNGACSTSNGGGVASVSFLATFYKH